MELEKKMVQFVIGGGVDLGIEAVPCRPFQRMAKMDKDWNLNKLGQLFDAMPTRITQKIISSNRGVTTCTHGKHVRTWIPEKVVGKKSNII